MSSVEQGSSYPTEDDFATTESDRRLEAYLEVAGKSAPRLEEVLARTEEVDASEDLIREQQEAAKRRTADIIDAEGPE